YEEAIAVYQSLAEEMDVSQYTRRVHIAQAMAALEEGENEEAVAYYKLAGDDEEIRNAVREIRLAQYDVLMEAGEYAQALDLLDAIENNTDWEDPQEEELGL
ncbi:MAG: tetratricopeptide repeat protein, partial [Clostridia bacterium]|nr:tetratricopeptide repeat protein [Clostridia bacterium]